MFFHKKRIFILGAGPSARETYLLAKRCDANVEYFVSSVNASILDNIDAGRLIFNKPIISFEQYKKMVRLKDSVIIGIGNQNIREDIYKQILEFNNDTIFENLFDYTIEFLDIDSFEFDEGIQICANSIISTNVNIGKCCQININTSISHDCHIGNFVTISPGVTICGNVTIGNNCFIGAGAVIMDHLQICDDVTIGIGSVVIKNITKPGTYIGVPAKIKE
jgi:sugar O-acyltransferase (sialic acid O-acetyltransferase NeuD family)